MGSSEENHLPHFRKSDVIDDVIVMSWVGDDVTCQFFRDDSITAKADNDITKSRGTTILQTSSTRYTPYRTCIPNFLSGAPQPFKMQRKRGTRV